VAGPAPEELSVGVHIRVPDDGVRLTYRQRTGKKRVTIRCLNDEKAPFSQDCDDALRILNGEALGTDAERSESGTQPPDDVKPAAPKTEGLSNHATAISQCVQMIQDANIATQRVVRAIWFLERAGDLSADESVSYEFEFPQISATLTLDSNGFLTIHDGVNLTAAIMPFSELGLREAFENIRRAVDTIPSNEGKTVPVKVVRNFYDEARSTMTYRNRVTDRTYRFRCETDKDVVASPEIDLIITIFYATANW
jgi:hypothetical protein